MTRDELVSVLEGCAHLCLDTEEERRMVAERLATALRADPDAVLIRGLFEHAHTTGGRMVAVSSHGKRLGFLVDAAARLAGCEEEEEEEEAT